MVIQLTYYRRVRGSRICDRDAFGTPTSPGGCEGKYRRTLSPARDSIRVEEKPKVAVRNLRTSPAKSLGELSPMTPEASESSNVEKKLNGRLSIVEQINRLRLQSTHQSNSSNKPLLDHIQPQLLSPPKLPPKPKTRLTPPRDSVFLATPINILDCKPSSVNPSQLSPASYPYKQHQHNSNSSKNQNHQISQDFPAQSYNAVSHIEGSNLWKIKEQTTQAIHSHSNSDSGLSSMSGHTMSPTSNRSAMSSSSSSSSSTSSLRSPSVSRSVPVEAQKKLFAESDYSPMKRPTVLYRKHLGEEVDCQELSSMVMRELRLEGVEEEERSKKLMSLFGLSSYAKASNDLSSDLSMSFGQRAEELKIQNICPSILKTHLEQLRNENCGIPTISSEEHLIDPPKVTVKKLHEAILLRQKKESLLCHITKKLDALHREQQTLKEETRTNEASGRRISSHLAQTAQPGECERYRVHVEETDKIASLLFGLAGRLARAENDILGLADVGDREERAQLLAKRDKLSEQLSEAKKLKDSIDKRSQIVSSILLKYLNEDVFSDYQNFIQTKVRLILHTREVLEKIALGKEQLEVLRETM